MFERMRIAGVGTAIGAMTGVVAEAIQYYWAPQLSGSFNYLILPVAATGGFFGGVIYGYVTSDESTYIIKQTNAATVTTSNLAAPKVTATQAIAPRPSITKFTDGDLGSSFQTLPATQYSWRDFQNAAKKACEIYNNETRIPFTKSKLAGLFGFFSFARHSTEDGNNFVKEIKSLERTAPMYRFIVETLKLNGSLWDQNKGHNHSFNNYFLTCLRQENIVAYREVISNAYGITFITSGITLYRRDTRSKDIIFDEGFQLKKGENDYSTRKNKYTEPVTYAFGVSFSKTIPPTGYGNRNEYYVVALSDNHNFLLVDIVNSPCNKRKLTPYQMGLQEVNSLDAIPSQAVQHLVTQTPHGFYSYAITQNPKFSSHARVDESNKMGCY